MEKQSYKVEEEKPFSESLIWELNRDYYNTKGIEAWRKDDVPHHLTSNSMVGKTYAELIFAFLKDTANKGQIKETVYILELGAGHGRLAFHILKHLGKLTEQVGLELPPYCYILSDLAQDNLDFFYSHPQFHDFYEAGLLDVAHFDAIESKELVLRHSKTKITPQDLKQPLLVLANYFFDSISNDLFHFDGETITECWVGLESNENPEGKDVTSLLASLQVTYHKRPMEFPFYEDQILNDILESYQELLVDTYLFFPHKGLQCLQNLRQLSQKGLMLISMDKGFHELHDLKKVKEPEMINHGSISFWVNYHAFGTFCERHKGKALFPEFSNFHLELACLMFLENTDSYIETQVAYKRFVNDFGPDDFNSFKQFTYKNIANMNLLELIGVLRLSAYDSTLFTNVLPRLKQLAGRMSFNERKRLSQTLEQTWNMYFTLNESEDLAFEIGGVFYGLGMYKKALIYFQHSINLFGHSADGYYNRALCYYQLREDKLFIETVKKARKSFPNFQQFEHLDKLDLAAK